MKTATSCEPRATSKPVARSSRLEARSLLSEVRQNFIAKQLRLSRTIVSPDFEHDMSATSSTIFFDFLNALVRRARDRADFAQQFITHGLRRGFAAARFHGVRNRLQFVESDPCGFEQHVGRALDVLHLV